MSSGYTAPGLICVLIFNTTTHSQSRWALSYSERNHKANGQCIELADRWDKERDSDFSSFFPSDVSAFITSQKSKFNIPSSERG